MQAFTDELLRGNEGAQEGKRVIVNIASILGKRGPPDLKHYAASKGGVTEYSKSRGAEMGRYAMMLHSPLINSLNKHQVHSLDAIVLSWEIFFFLLECS